MALGAKDITEELYAYSKKYNFEILFLENTKYPVLNYLWRTISIVFPGLTLHMLQLLKADAVVAITKEKIIRRNLKWLNRSDFFYYISEDQWNFLMNKKKFSDYSSKFGLSRIPEYSYEEISNTAGNFNYPVVIKPVDGSGSSGVSICNDLSELKKGIVEARKHSRNGQILIQKFLKGPYFQFEIWMQEGKAFCPYVKDRVYYPAIGNCPPQPFIDVYPSVNKNKILDSLFNNLANMMRSLNIYNGSCMFQGIINHGVPYVMDVAYRISGGMDYKVVREEKNIDLIEAHVLYALGHPFGSSFSALKSNYQHYYAVLCIGLKNGKIARIAGLEKIRELPFVFNCYAHYNVGYRMRSSGRFSQVGFRIFIKADERRLLIKYIKTALELLRVEDENGDSLLLDYPDVILP